MKDSSKIQLFESKKTKVVEQVLTPEQILEQLEKSKELERQAIKDKIVSYFDSAIQNSSNYKFTAQKIKDMLKVEGG